MADDFKKQSMRSHEWGRKARKAMKRSARTAIKRDTAKELVCEDVVYAQLIEALEYDESCEQDCSQPEVLYGVETDPASLWNGEEVSGWGGPLTIETLMAVVEAHYLAEEMSPEEFALMLRCPALAMYVRKQWINTESTACAITKVHMLQFHRKILLEKYPDFLSALQEAAA